MLAFLLLAASLAAQSEPRTRLLNGQVLDPEGLPVSDASVRLACDGFAEAAARSDRGGRFEIFAPADARRCVVSATREGFREISREVQAAAHSLLLHLSLPAIVEHVTVRADAGDAWPGAARVPAGVLREFVNDTPDMLDYARALAGDLRNSRVFVDGVPGGVLPAPDRVASISVNPDAFSAAFSDLDGARVEIETAPLEPVWRYTLSASPGTFSGAHPLGGGHSWRTRSVAAALSGPLASSRLAWAIGAAGTTRSQSRPLIGSVPIELDDGEATAENRETVGDAFAAMSYRTAATRVSTDLTVRRERSEALDAGGLAATEAASDAAADVVALTVSVRSRVRSVALTSTAQVTTRRARAWARGDGRPTSEYGGLVGGGAAIDDSRTEESSGWWSVAASGAHGGRQWRAGAALSAARAAQRWRPNAQGLLLLSPGSDSHPLFLQLERGDGAASARVRGAAAYGEAQLVRTSALTLNTGLRFDGQAGDGATLSPRLSGEVRRGRYTLTFGAGRFVEEWSARALLPLRTLDEGGTTRLLYEGRCAADPGLAGCFPAYAHTSVSMSRRRQALASVGLARSAGAVWSSAEYRWSRVERVPSLTRDLDAQAWLETFGSEGSARGHELRLRARVGARRPSLAAHYTWRRARDTSDGWYGAPRDRNAPEAWARTAGLAPHEGGIVVTCAAPGRVSASAIGTFSSGSPVDLLFSPADLRQALAEPRREGSRNAGATPGSAVVSLYLSRALTLRPFRVRGRLGMQLTNLLGRRNLLAPVTIVDSPLYGRATDAGAGRSLKIWFALGD